MNVLLKVNQACRIGGSNSKEEVSCCTLDVFACFELVHPLLCGAVGISLVLGDRVREQPTLHRDMTVVSYLRWYRSLDSAHFSLSILH